MQAASAVDNELWQNERYLWGLCYRLTGSAADADDIVQETFAKTLESPPPDRSRPLRPWLVKVAMNLGRDLLRRRRRSGYRGPWLPAPVPTDRLVPPSYEIETEERLGTAGRYDLLESVSFAFLLALEALTPAQRAVLLLRDVFDYSVRETAEALEMSEANVRTTLHRARTRLSQYDAERRTPSVELLEQTRSLLAALNTSLLAGDVDELRRLFSSDAVQMSDGGGKFYAAARPIHGPEKIANLYARLLTIYGAPAGLEVADLNGVPALVIETNHPDARVAPRFVVMLDVDRSGRIRRLYSILATAKLTAIP